jgi:4-hydroxy-3-methylbut-2-en-1-yl diphosphate synthase IspG/GcpE
MEDLGFQMIKMSLKASDVPRTIEAYRLISQKTDCPLHLGITEAGIGPGGVVKSSIGLAGGKGAEVLFKRGEIIKKVKEKDFASVLLKEIQAMILLK